MNPFFRHWGRRLFRMWIFYMAFTLGTALLILIVAGIASYFDLIPQNFAWIGLPCLAVGICTAIAVDIKTNWMNR